MSKSLKSIIDLDFLLQNLTNRKAKNVIHIFDFFFIKIIYLSIVRNIFQDRQTDIKNKLFITLFYQSFVHRKNHGQSCK